MGVYSKWMCLRKKRGKARSQCPNIIPCNAMCPQIDVQVVAKRVQPSPRRRWWRTRASTRWVRNTCLSSMSTNVFFSSSFYFIFPCFTLLFSLFSHAFTLHVWEGHLHTGEDMNRVIGDLDQSHMYWSSSVLKAIKDLLPRHYCFIVPNHPLDYEVKMPQ